MPPIEDLLKFLRRKADQAEEEEIPLTRRQSEKPNNKHQSSKQRGSVHVATPQTASHPPPYQAPQPATVQTTPPPQRGRGAQHKQKTAYPPCRYVCPLCTENHYAFSCSIFENYTVAQMLESIAYAPTASRQDTLQQTVGQTTDVRSAEVHTTLSSMMEVAHQLFRLSKSLPM